MDEKGNLVVRNRHNGMTVGYGPVQDFASHGPLSPIATNNNPFDTLQASPSADRVPNFRSDDACVNTYTRGRDDGDAPHDGDPSQALQPFDGNRGLRRAQVIRKVNSGFEILRPGTLCDPRESSDNTKGGTKSAKGPIRHSRRLYKKSQPTPNALENS